MTPLALAVYLVIVTWAVFQSNRRWMTLLWIVVGVVGTLGAFAALAAIWPDRAAILGHIASISCLLVSALFGVNHIRLYGRPSDPKLPVPEKVELDQRR
jgi:heme A synthase